MRQGPSSSFKKRTLEDLFRPPIDITFKGTFSSVRTFVRPCYYISFPVPHLFQILFSKKCIIYMGIFFKSTVHLTFCLIFMEMVNKSIINIVRNFKNPFLTTGQRSGYKAKEIRNGQCSE